LVPMRALLDTGTTATIILREFVGKGRARINTKKRTKWKTLGGTFTTNYESLLDFNVKLLPLPQPSVRARTDARTNPSAQRATQLRSVLAHM
jgi:hypothetical protein